MNRLLRAGLVAAGSVTAASVVFATGVERGACRSTADDDLGCLGQGLVLAVGCSLAVVVSIAWGLRGRGTAHAMLGAALCLVVGYAVTDRLTFLKAWWPEGRSGHDAVAAVAFGVVTGALAVLWARFGPGRGPGETGAARSGSAGAGEASPPASG